MNTNPVMEGLCIIQARRTSKVVPYETVPHSQGRGAQAGSEGDFVTTSWFGRSSEAFANELLDGANLVHLFKEHMGPDVIPGPVPR